MKKLFIVGGTSSIGMGVAKAFAGNGWGIYLAGRNVSKLRHCSSILQDACLGTFEFDILKDDSNILLNSIPPINAVLCTVGLFDNRTSKNLSTAENELIWNINCNAPTKFLSDAATLLPTPISILAISSIAALTINSGYSYGQAKKKFSSFINQLRLQYPQRHIMEIMPGWVDSPMTKNRLLPSLFSVSAEYVGLEIYRAFIAQKNFVITPKFWNIFFPFRFLSS